MRKDFARGKRESRCEYLQTPYSVRFSLQMEYYRFFSPVVGGIGRAFRYFPGGMFSVFLVLGIHFVRSRVFRYFPGNIHYHKRFDQSYRRYVPRYPEYSQAICGHFIFRGLGAGDHCGRFYCPRLFRIFFKIHHVENGPARDHGHP